MARYKYQDLSQGLFLNINLKDQLLPGTFEWTLEYLIDHSDLSLFDLQYDNDILGAPAYPPATLLKVIFYCYSRGIITSRPIEKAAQTNIIVKALAADAEPDHDTITHFISSNSVAVQDLFAQILLRCSEFRRRDPYFDDRKGHKANRFTAHDFTYNKESNTFICPNKKTLIYKGFVKLNRNSGDKYQASPKDCMTCQFLSRCVASRKGKTHMRTLYIPVSKHSENLCDKMRKVRFPQGQHFPQYESAGGA